MKVKVSALFLFFILFAIFSIQPAWAAFDSAQFNQTSGPLDITRITPTGMDVPPGRQIVITFNRPVVPVGKMERDSLEIPVTIDPPLQCEWRWLNTSALACQLTEANAMAPATHYRMTIKPGIKDESGATIKETMTHEFTTQRPEVESNWFKTWESPGSPVIQVRFDQPVTQSSVEAHLFFVDEDGTRHAVKAEMNTEDDWYKKGRVWFLRSVDELPLDSSIKLRVEPGIVATGGPEHGVEDSIVVEFDTFPEFRFMGVECTTTGDSLITMSPGSSSYERCDPLNDVSLLFTTPVSKESIQKNLTVVPDLAGGRTDYDPWEDVYGDFSLSMAHSRGHLYTVDLPEMLKAYSMYRLTAAANLIRDAFDRPLAEDINFTFHTDHRKPYFSLKSHTFVLEKGVDSEVPLVVTNINKISLDYSVMTSSGIRSDDKTIKLPDAEDIAYKTPFDTRDLIQAPSGAMYATFDTSPSVKGKDEERDRWFFSQVSPFNVQVKVGHYNTLVWVMDFATGKPVPGVSVDIYPGTMGTFDSDPKIMSQGVTDSNGIAILAGTEYLDPNLNLLGQYDWNLYQSRQLFVRCRRGGDMALLPLATPFELDTRGTGGTDIDSYLNRRYGHVITWGTTAQGIYKTGETVQFKFYVRDQNNNAFIMPPRGTYQLKVIDPMDKTVYEVKNITLSTFGSYSGEFTVPKTGAVGWYSFQLSSNFWDQSWEPMRVLVSDFTPSPFKVRTELNGELFSPGDAVTVQTEARLHAGGPYASAQSRVTAIITGSELTPKDPHAKGFYFDVYTPDYHPGTVHQSEATLDDKGDLKTEFKMPDANVLYGRLTVESAVRDDRGKYVANAATASYAGRDRYVGINQPDWVLNEGKQAVTEAVVVDSFGKIAKGTPIAFKVEYEETTASRVKGAGNAYLTRYDHKWVQTDTCSATSGSEPSTCTFTPEHTGVYRITASIRDTKGRAHESQISRWVVGKGVVLWDSGDNNTLQIFPEKDQVAIGDTARYLVQNPFPGAKALITIERYGVLDSWVQTLDSSTAIVEFKVKPNYLPGYYLSVVIFSPRTDKPISKDQVDLGKPAFRMGYVRVPVNDPYKQINVKVTTDKKEYRPRDTVTVDLQASVKTDNPGNLPPDMELAVAVVDESVLDLIPGGTAYYDPYRGFYNLDTLDMQNYSLLVQLLGRQLFEKKGADSGGGGGMDISLRSLFKFVSYWNPSILTDKDGKAHFTFQVPDNLTGWRILVLAVTSTDHMGLGQGSFKVNRPTEVRAALPNQVLEGDSFDAGFTVMNRTDKVRTLKVTMQADGPLEGYTKLDQTVKAPPYKRVPLWLPLKTNKYGTVTFTVTAKDNFDGDSLRKTMPVRKRVSFETGATYGTTVADSVSENIAFPEGIRTDVGSVSLVASATVIGSVKGAFEYMKEYPYLCWEQKLTKGVMAAHYQNLRAYLPKDFSWDESKGIPEETLKEAANYQAPNGGMVYYVPDNQYVSPYLSAYTALAFNWLRRDGYDIPETVEKKLHEYLLNMLRQDVMPTFYSDGMSSTVRAVALAALAPHGEITLSDLKRYWGHVHQMSLFGKAQYLDALLQVDGTGDMRKDVFDMIMAHANETGGKFIFSEELDAIFQRILATPLRDNCAVLGAILRYSETPQGASSAGEIPFKLVRTITQSRRNRSYWENTQENMFCMNALIDYSRIYEKEKPDFTLKAWLGKENMGTAKFTDFRDKPVELVRPITKDDPGQKRTMKIERTGTGRLYYSARMSYAPTMLKATRVNSGIEVRREYSVERDGKWVLLGQDMKIKRGELVRVDLFVSLPSARNFVVVNDPVPGGLEPVNRQLATASIVDADKAKYPHAGTSFWFEHDDWFYFGFSHWSFYHKELRHHAAQFYSEYLPAGDYFLSYTAQAIAPGKFTVLPVHAEEMYDPDVYGKGLPAKLTVTH